MISGGICVDRVDAVAERLDNELDKEDLPRSGMRIPCSSTTSMEICLHFSDEFLLRFGA